MTLKSTLFALSLAFVLNQSTASETKKSDTTKQYEIAPDDQVLTMIDSAMANQFFSHYRIPMPDSSILVDRLIPLDSLVPLYDSVLEDRLRDLNAQTPIELDYNKYVKAFINLYINKKRDLSAIVLGTAPRYFPMFEEVLDRYQMPLELKHLAIVESALNPSARSWVGAQGLWQFMYRTGKMYDLQVTSYYDDRMDPYKSTVAACEYMMDLHKMYDDWNLVLAAYNSGPGNVNRAIRRSGGHKDYWKIRPFLPRETRGYVPAFIAVNYMMNYAEEHHIYPLVTPMTNALVDTVHLKRSMSFAQISNYVDVSEELLADINPMYKLKFIPESKEEMTLCLPLDKIGLFLVNEKAIYADMRRIKVEDSVAGKEKEDQTPEMLVHYVRSGEFLGYIANKYRCSVRDLMAWNNLRSSRLDVGDRLVIYSRSASQPAAAASSAESKPSQTEEKEVPQADGKYQIHVVRSGDTLWDIAKKYNNTSVTDLKKLNSNLDFRRLKPGMEVKVKEIG
jgi:membrane-bound lytic murein transglycosylase D